MNILQRMKDYRAVTSRRKRYVTRFKQTLERLGIPNKPVGGEDDYIRFWSRLSNHVEPYSFRLYSRYLEWDGKGNIIPEDIAHSYIEPYLNPIKFRGYYTDKNMYAQYLQPASAFPKTLLCRVAGSVLMDGSFKPILSFVADSMTFYDYLKEYERVVIKPSVNSKGGAGVMLFEKANGFFAHDDGTVVLDGCFLQQYGNDFVVQEVVSQHPYLAQFNPSSLNSIRVCMYRSVVTETVKMAAAAIRIGKSGSFVDNTHSGGGLVVVDPETGKLGTTAYNWEGISIDTLNGVDFRQEEYVIPYWERIRDFAISIASQNHHCRLIALDLTLDKDNVPRMIEYNVNAFSYRIPMLGGRSLFGDETQDVIDYCKRMQKDMDKISVLWTGGLDSTYLVAKLLRWGG